MGTVSPRMTKNPQHHKEKLNEVILALNNYLALPMITIIICMECIWFINDLLLLKKKSKKTNPKCKAN